MSKLDDNKLKRIFINNFFKTKYFRELDMGKYNIKDYDYHQLIFIFKFSPEAMLYSIDKFIKIDNFDKQKLYKFFKVRYKEILQQPFNDEQLYFYCAINMLEFKEILLDNKDIVFKSNNQVLISYYLKDGLFKNEDINTLKLNTDERYWFQNYHLILYSTDLLYDLENSINKYLMPVNARKDHQKKSYMDFYKENLQLKKHIIRSISDVYDEVKDYLRLKIQENEDNFEEEE